MRTSPVSIVHILLFSGGLILRELVRQLRPSAIAELAQRLGRQLVKLFSRSKRESYRSPHYTQSPEGRLGVLGIVEIRFLKPILVDPNDLRDLEQAVCRLAAGSIPLPALPQVQYDPIQSSTPPRSPDMHIIYSLQKYAELVKAGKLPTSGQSISLPLPVDTRAETPVPAEQTASEQSLTSQPTEVLPGVLPESKPTQSGF